MAVAVVGVIVAVELEVVFMMNFRALELVLDNFYTFCIIKSMTDQLSKGPTNPIIERHGWW